MKIRDFHHAANLHLSKENDFWPELAPYYRHAWERSFYKNVRFSGEAGILILQSCHVFSWRQELSCQGFFEFNWHSFTWIKIILWQIIVIMKVDGQYYFIFLIWSVDYYYSILSLSTLQPTMRCFRIPCIPFLFWPAWLCRNLSLLIS